MKKLVIIALVLFISVFGLGQTCLGIERGGVLKMIAGSFPKNFHPNEGAPSDGIALLPVCERLIDWDEEGRYIPVLLETWTEDAKANIVVFKLKKGIRFHDGTPFNAEAVKWNYELRMSKNRLVGADNIIRMEVVDDYTLRFVLKKLQR